MSLDGAKKPDHLITFAGVDKEAVDAARRFLFLHHHHLWRCSKTEN
jgi:hypothetical protein